MWEILTSSITGSITKFFEYRQVKTEAKRAVEVAGLNNRARLLEGEQSHNSEMEMKQLEVAAPWMRRIIVAHILVLMDIAVVSPIYAQKIFTALDKVPTWIIGLFVTVFGFYFAIRKMSEIGTALVAKKFNKE